MNTHRHRGLTLLLLIPAFMWACDKKEEVSAKPEAKEVSSAVTPLEQARTKTGLFAALPKDWSKEGHTKELEDLGRVLYYETRMSKNHDISCNSCHMLNAYGVDSLPTSPGHKKALGSRNSPTVYNAAGHAMQFWDGRAADVEEQAKGPILNPVEMAMSDAQQVEAVLGTIPGYLDLFTKAFPGQDDPISYENVSIAIGAFERRLVTPSRWDAFLGGDDDALSADEIEGFNLFASTGCMACHNGALVGGTTFHQLGAITPWPNQKDQGLFELTKKEEDRMKFKAPSLRNIAKTGPYFHDGSVTDLEQVVSLMATHQLGQTLSGEQTRLIVAWLDTLTGDLDLDYIEQPVLPVSGPDTPGPEPN